MLQILQAVGHILSRLAELLGQVSGWLGQLLVVLLGVAGIVAGLALLLSVYVAFGALLEYWIRWAWNRKRQVWPVVVTVILWPVVAAFGVALIGAVPLAYKWWNMSVDWAIAVGLLGIVVSIMANNRFNPLDRPVADLVRLYRTVRPYPKGIINASGAGIQVIDKPVWPGAALGRAVVVGDEVVLFKKKNGFYRIGDNEWLSETFIDRR